MKMKQFTPSSHTHTRAHTHTHTVSNAGKGTGILLMDCWGRLMGFAHGLLGETIIGSTFWKNVLAIRVRGLKNVHSL